jgi:hypothetical protein
MEGDNSSVLSFNEDEDDLLSVEACISFYEEKSISENRTLASVMELFGWTKKLFTFQYRKQKLLNSCVDILGATQS